jgi:hypothetical protein
MSIAAEELPLPRRGVRKKKLPRRCRAAMDISEIYAVMLPNFYASSFSSQVFNLFRSFSPSNPFITFGLRILLT